MDAILVFPLLVILSADTFLLVYALRAKTAKTYRWRMKLFYGFIVYTCIYLISALLVQYWQSETVINRF